MQSWCFPASATPTVRPTRRSPKSNCIGNAEKAQRAAGATYCGERRRSVARVVCNRPCHAVADVCAGRDVSLEGEVDVELIHVQLLRPPRSARLVGGALVQRNGELACLGVIEGVASDRP